LLASLEKRSIHGVLGCFLGVEDEDDLEKGFLADETIKDEFSLLWKAVTEPEVKAFPCFRE